MRPPSASVTILLAVLWLSAPVGTTRGEEIQPPGEEHVPGMDTFVSTFCLDCHNSADATAGVDLESLHTTSVSEDIETWEKVVKKLQSRQMPPTDAEHPDESTVVEVLHSLEEVLDQHAEQHPRSVRAETFRRLTRTEYRNAIRDLLALDVDIESMLPADEISHGFDNITVGELSPTLVNRYLSAAQRISRLAIGRPPKSPDGITVRIPPDVTQDEHVEGLPLGTRGGGLIPYTFPQDGEYEIQVRLARDRDEHIEGLKEPHQLEVLLDRRHLESFKIKPPGARPDPSDKDAALTHASVDQHLKIRFSATAGPHQIGVTFVKNPSSLLESKRQPLNVHFNVYRHPRLGPAVYQISITGPFDVSGPGETPSRQRIFACRPAAPEEEDECAEIILSTLLRRACRRPVALADLTQPMALYHQGREQGDFEDGIELALSSILIHPEFLFRIERDPAGLAPGTIYQISDTELASRLSFFLWSSLPDDQLLNLAEQGKLSDPDILEQQTRRMLADDRASALVSNFAAQWLYLRNLNSITPDARLYPDFDENLRQAMRRETELFFESVMREDRSVLDLLRSNITYLNERLAKHYGIPHVYGSRFRRVDLGEDSHRGGLLRQGSVLTVTSYATRTSPVLRGKWILENILGTPTPPPPPDIPALSETTVAATLPLRERLAHHRADPACASCHNLLDPPGFALENFDAVGRWRQLDAGRPVDSVGGLPDGRTFTGVAGLEQGLLDRPDLFVSTMTEKLLTYALGRGNETSDAPEIRKIVRNARHKDYRFSSLILGVVTSTPFRTRTTQ